MTLEQRLVEYQQNLAAQETRFRHVIEKNADGTVIVDSEGVVRFINPAAETMLAQPAEKLVGEFLGFPVVAGDSTEIDLFRGAGNHVIAEMRVVETVWEGQPAFLASLRDITERKRIEKALEREADINRTLAELSKALIAHNTLEEISVLVLEHAQRLTGSAFGFVGHIDPDTGYLVSSTLTKTIWDTCRLPGKDFVFETFSGLWGWVLNERQSLLTNTPATDPRSAGTPAGHLPIHRFLAAPAVVGESLVGEVALANADRDYTPDDLALLERLASLYALAVQRRLSDQTTQQALAQAQQRQREVAKLLEGAQAILEHQEFDLAAQHIFDACKTLIGAESGYVARLAETGEENEIVFLDPGGRPCTADPNLPMPIRGLREVAYREQKAVYENDFPASEWEQWMPTGHVQLDNVLFAPLILEERTIGLLGLANKPGGFTPHDAHMATAFGELAAIAMRNSQMLDSLEVSEARFRMTFETNPDAIAITRQADGLYVMVNQGFTDATGYTWEDLAGRTALDPQIWQNPEDRARLVTALQTHGEIKDLEAPFRMKNGVIKTGLMSIKVITLNNEPHLISITRDITAQKMAAQTLERQAEELARSNAELQHFAYVASHDLREPLRMVTSYLQLLQRRYRGQLDNDADVFIAYAVDGAKRMDELIKGLLEYSRVRPDTMIFKPVDCAKALEHVLTDLQVVIAERNARITYSALPTVVADEVQLLRLFRNLIDNAIKFNQTAQPEVHISAERQEMAWRFAVRDNGIGIEIQHAERIFLIFQRLHTREEYPGAGIGLAVCKRIVEHHGGQIGMQPNHSDVGVTFHFTIPDRAPQPTE